MDCELPASALVDSDSGDGLRQLPKAPREELAKKKFFTGVFYSSYMRFSEPEMEAFLLGSSRMSSIPSEDDRVFTPACRLLGIHQLPEQWPRVRVEHLVITVDIYSTFGYGWTTGRGRITIRRPCSEDCEGVRISPSSTGGYPPRVRHLRIGWD